MFLCDREEFKDFFGNKSLRMVSFYQMMRKKLNVLMENEKPIGGKWSFDDENRKKLPIFMSDEKVGIYTFAALFAEGFYQLLIVLQNIMNPIMARQFSFLQIS